VAGGFDQFGDTGAAAVEAFDERFHAGLVLGAEQERGKSRRMPSNSSGGLLNAPQPGLKSSSVRAPL